MAIWKVQRRADATHQEILHYDLMRDALAGKVVEVAQLISQKANVNIYVVSREEGCKLIDCEPLISEVIFQSSQNPKCLKVLKLLLGAKANIDAPCRSIVIDCMSSPMFFANMYSKKALAILEAHRKANQSAELPNDQSKDQKKD